MRVHATTLKILTFHKAGDRKWSSFCEKLKYSVIDVHILYARTRILALPADTLTIIDDRP